jgi:hypothetical protein
MTASLLRSVLRGAFAPALLGLCVLATNTGCDGEEEDGWDGDERPSGKCGGRRRPPPGESDLGCPSSAVFSLSAPGATRAGVDPSTLWVRACVDSRCTDQPLFTGATDLAEGEGEGESVFTFDVGLADLDCRRGPSLAAISLYDTLDKAPLFTAVREVSLACDARLGCRAPVLTFEAPGDIFRCEQRGALIALQAPEAIPLSPDAVPVVIVCVDGSCSDAIQLPVNDGAIDTSLAIDVMIQGVDRSKEEATTHEVTLKVGPGRDSALFTETFELLLEPATSFACDLERAPDFVLPLRPDMFADLGPGGGRPPPYVPTPTDGGLAAEGDCAADPAAGCALSPRPARTQRGAMVLANSTWGRSAAAIASVAGVSALPQRAPRNDQWWRPML